MSSKNVRVISVNRSVFATNDRIAEETREQMKRDKTFFVNVMASPGAGKSTTLLRTISELKEEFKIGVMEADIDATVDAEKMQAAGVDSIQVHTEGECAMNAGMVKKSLESFPSEEYDLLFLENVGNLVCP
ncbi:MAG: hydrogenase accessory protein HypB, partial [Lachnospiraceae bacterium]|nr:hydrogenase accessory protein HypB [Lachnospiraceae bacterium]